LSYLRFISGSSISYFILSLIEAPILHLVASEATLLRLKQDVRHLKSLLLIKYVCVLILQRSRFFIEFLELISLIELSYFIHQIMLLSLWPFVLKLKFFSQFYLLYDMLHNLGVQLFYFILFFRLPSIMNFNFP
jgi:hypothetical protein